MLKLLLLSAVLTPCIFMQVSASIEAESVSYNTPSFESVYIDPEFENLESCGAAELDIYFHEKYVTMHSAEYIAEALALAGECSNAEYIIQPIQPIHPASESMDAAEITSLQASELSLMLKAHGVEARIAATKVESEFDSLSENGRTAILRISMTDGKTA